MDSGPSTPSAPTRPNCARKLLHRTAELIRKHPVVFVAVVALAMFAVAMQATGPAGSSTLRVQMQHGFRSADLSIWVDERAVYSGHVSGALRKRFGLIPTAVQGSFSQTVQVPAGNHSVRVRVTADGGAYDHSGTTQANFAPNTQLNLRITPRRSGDLGLNWDGLSTVAAASVEPAWYVKYAGSLLMTAAGSLVSALTAFLVKELPNLVRRTSSTDQGA